MFQSAPPVKGATYGVVRSLKAIVVSIRAPREGGDYVTAYDRASATGFNPRPP